MERIERQTIAVLSIIALMMAISPCPMATNVTAIAYVSRKIGDSRYTILVGLLSGLVPAIQAASMIPVNALKYE